MEILSLQHNSFIKMPPHSVLDNDASELAWNEDISSHALFLRSHAMKALMQEGSNHSTARRRCRVTFAPVTEIQEVPHVNDLDPEEISEIWYCKRDYEMIKSTYMQTVRMMANGSTSQLFENEDDHCFRGLEYRTREGARRRQSNKITAITAVLDEQDRQIYEGIWDPEALADTYRRTSAHCTDAAFLLGLRDEQDTALSMSSLEELTKEILGDDSQNNYFEARERYYDDKEDDDEQNNNIPGPPKKSSSGNSPLATPKRLNLRRLFTGTRNRRKAVLEDIQTFTTATGSNKDKKLPKRYLAGSAAA